MKKTAFYGIIALRATAYIHKKGRSDEKQSVNQISLNFVTSQ